jgi:hypothetical protein
MYERYCQKKYAVIGAAAAGLIYLLSPGLFAARAQAPTFTLVGSWTVDSTPIDGKVESNKGNTLGFPVRPMIFAQDGSLNTGMVLREDEGPNVKPLGVWRVDGSNLSCAFELWCPTAPPCGSVVVRGAFQDANTIKGTMTVFFDTPDDTTPTGLDTWVFAFHGTRN